MYILRPLPMKNLNFTLRRSRFCLKSGYHFILVNLLNLLNYYVLVSINKFYNRVKDLDPKIFCRIWF